MMPSGAMLFLAWLALSKHVHKHLLVRGTRTMFVVVVQSDDNHHGQCWEWPEGLHMYEYLIKKLHWLFFIIISRYALREKMFAAVK